MCSRAPFAILRDATPDVAPPRRDAMTTTTTTTATTTPNDARTLSPAAATNGQLWGGKARAWAELQEPISRPLYLAALERARVTSGTAYLDVGCGAGTAASVAAERGAKVSGLDAAEALLAIARERTPAGDFRLGELEALPFPAASFEVITGFNSFQFAVRPIAALEEARRVARPGARIVIATWGRPEDTQAPA